MFRYKGFLSSISQDEERAWKIIFMKNSGEVYRIARLITGDNDEAKDVVQQTFIHAYERTKLFKSLDELVDYLHLKAKYNALDRLRRIKTRKKYEDGYGLETESSHTPAYAKDDDDGTTFLKEAALEHLHQLPPQQQKIVHLIYWKDMTIKEVAVLLQISEQTVRNHLSRALVTLAKRLGIERNKKRRPTRSGQEPEK